MFLTAETKLSLSHYIHHHMMTPSFFIGVFLFGLNKSSRDAQFFWKSNLFK